jgi:hypothetical protein
MLMLYSAANVHDVDNYCHVFLAMVKQYSEFGTFPVSEKAIGEMPAGVWRFPFLVFDAAFFGSRESTSHGGPISYGDVLWLPHGKFGKRRFRSRPLRAASPNTALKY